MDEENAIVVQDLRKSYGDVHVLKGIDLTVRRGSVLGLLGPNGAGKTTLVRILTTLTAATSGKASVNGYDVMTQPEGVRSSSGLVNQFMALDYVHSGRENLVMLGRLLRIGTTAAKRRAEELIEQFDLTEAANRPVSTYSGGMKRRLDLAISLITAPPVLFLDEPTVGLDPRSRIGLWEAIQTLVDNGSTVFLTTQYLEEADQLADQVAVLDDGRIIAAGTAAELKRRVGTERLEVVFTDSSDFATARQSLSSAALTWTVADRKVTVTAEEPSELVRMLGEIDRTGARIESLAITKPTLDDVFIEFTDKSATRESEKAG